jgi:hypothetical protein
LRQKYATTSACSLTPTNAALLPASREQTTEAVLLFRRHGGE